MTLGFAVLAWVLISIGAAALHSARRIAARLRPRAAVTDLMIAIIVAAAGLQLVAVLSLRKMGMM